MNQGSPRRLAAVALLMLAASAGVRGWGAQGHRLAGLLAANHLTPVARANVAWLLDGRTLADVSIWADTLVSDNQQTGWWHYLNIPPDAAGYDRDRDCPRQPGVAAGSRADTWRDCVVDRITYFEQRLANRALDRADRATALKFIVHFVGDLHQPFHALGVGRGGNEVIVKVFGEVNCGGDPARPPVPCTLHSVWDSRLIAHRGLDDAQYLAVLEKLRAERRFDARAPGTPAEWAVESWALAKTALVPGGANIDEAYYTARIPVIDERLALAGVRLAAVLNRALTEPPGGQAP
jgi:hypothetical protein